MSDFWIGFIIGFILSSLAFVICLVIGEWL